MKKTILTLAVCVTSLCLAAAPLFDNGKSSWKVIIPTDSSTVNEHAAKEFTTAIKKISGVELPVVKADTVEGENNVIIGSLLNKSLIPQIADTIQLKKFDSVEDRIAVHTVKGNLYLAGNNPRSAAYAVYHFLREDLGVRWFWPGAKGEFMPAKKTFTVPEIAYNYQGAFRYRALSCVCRQGDSDAETFQYRTFINTGLIHTRLIKQFGPIRRIGTHSIGLDPKNFDKYPERFSLLSGKRHKDGVAGCWSNEDFKKQMVKLHADWIKRSKAELLCAFPADVTQRCECPDCTKLKDRSSRWFVFYAELIRAIKKECPDVRAASIAYQEYRDVPELPVEELEYVEYCTYNRCYVHPLNDPSCEMNKAVVDELKRWQKKAAMGIYGYEFDVFSFQPMMYLPIHNQIGASARDYRDLKMVRLKTEYPVRLPKKGQGPESAYHIPIRLSAYVFCMTNWNPDLKVDDLVRDYCNYVYGAGADAMYEYHTSMAKYWDTMPIHLTYFLQSPNTCSLSLLNPDRIKAMNAVLEKAGKAVAGMSDEKERARAAAEVGIEQRLFAQWVKIYERVQGKAYPHKLEKRPAGTDFDTLPALPVTSRKGTHKPTDIRMYYSEKGLHFRVVCNDEDMDKALYGEPVKDYPFWVATNVEFFIDFNNGQPYHQLGICPSGGYYDAIGNDSKIWDPEWARTIRIDKAKKQWTVEVLLPFSSFGGVVPKKGAQWKINIIRNGGASQTEPCGFPAPVYRDLDMGAYITF